MQNLDNTKELLSAVAGDMSAVEMMAAGLKGLVAAEISMKRQERNMTQKEFAAVMGVSQGMVSKWERGEINFTIETLCRIADKLDIRMQSPYVMKRPRAYGDGKVISFSECSNKNCWSSSSYGREGGYEYAEYEEM